MAALWKVGLVFGLILVLFRLKLHLGLAMVAAALFLGLLFGMPVTEMALTTLKALISRSMIEMLAVLILIMFLENILRRNGYLGRMLNALRGLARDVRLVIGVLPAFIGLLPSAGGAYFSAPMVAEVAEGTSLTPEQKSFTNYWYRHIWELFSPLYPAVVLLMEITRVPFGRILMYQAPLAALSVLMGLPFAFRGFRPSEESPVAEIAVRPSRRQLWFDLAVGVAPVMATILLVVAAGINLLIVLVLVVSVMLLICRYNARRTAEMAREAFSWKTLALIPGVYVFKEFLSASGAVAQLPVALSVLHLPLTAVLFTLPFTVGLLTGLSSGYVGATFPIVVSLVPTGPAGAPLLAFAFVSGYAGVMLSPAHLCGTLTVQYFGADYGRMWKKAIIPVLAVVLASLAVTMIFSNAL